MQKKAIIIGAGPAGLTAAYRLLKETDILPIVLEESDMVGGISRTVCHNGSRMDLGGHRFFSKNDEVMALWTELMPLQGAPAFDDLLLGREKPLASDGPDPETEEETMLVRDRVSRIYYLRKFFDYPITLKWETIRNMGLWRTCKAGVGYLWSAVFKREERTLKDFMINRFGVPLYHMFFESYNEKLWGRNPQEIAPDWGAQRIKGLSLSKAIAAMLRKALHIREKEGKVETSLIEQFVYPKKGPGQLWEKMAHEIERMGGRIVYGACVNKVCCSDGRICAVETENGERYTGDLFFSSMPIKDLIGAMDASVPNAVRAVAEGLPYRDFITVGLLVKKIGLKNETERPTLGNIVPDCWIYVQERDVHMGRIQVFNNWSPYMVQDPERTVWLGLEYFCNEGDWMWELSDDAFIDLARSELVKMKIIEEEDVLDAKRIRVKKAYPAYFDTYEQFETVRQYLEAIPNLYCIGRNGQHRYNNMDHSMLTAMEAVRSIVNGTDKSMIWNVNAEEEYHEVRQEQGK